ncbi:MAG: phosphosulfolactate synthase [Crocinitomicaceae bacterium]|nr:phosphosulfolactate synthase [Crocinitomicaceae bacterium]
MNFELPYIPERAEKPRKNGITMMMDKGLSLQEATSFIQANGNLTDVVKFGFGTAYVTNDLEKKLALYREAGIRPYFGGTLFEVFYARGKQDDYLRLLDKYKMDLVEVSDGSIIINHDEKCEIIHKLSKERTVLSEVGSKDAGILIAPNRWIKMMKTELEAGSWKVIAEGREAGNVGVFRPNGTAHTMLINKITAKVKPEDILWEAPIKNQQVWFIKLFGANVNLGNIAPNDVIPLECLRLGLRGDTFFEFLPKDYAERLKQVNDDDAIAEYERENSEE